MVALEHFEADLPQPGTATVEDNLIRYAQATLDLVAATLPIVAGLISEPVLLRRFIDEIHRQPYGPERMRQPIADYLDGEQRLGRLGTFELEPVLTLFLGQAMVLGFTSLMSGQSPEELAGGLPGIVTTLLRGLNPPSTG